MRKLSAALFFLFLVAATRAEWVAKSSHDEASPRFGIFYRHIDFQDADSGKITMVDLAIFPAKLCKLRVIDNADGTNSLADAMLLANCIAGANGGYFDPTFVPIGLRIIDGRATSGLIRGHLMSGVLGSDGAVQILRLAQFSRSKQFNAAVECGPFLVDLARSVRDLDAIRSARRTFVASGSNDRAALGFCPDATLAELAQILTKSSGDFKIERALNLDGGSSSAFWFARKDGSALSIPEQKSVRDFIAVVPR